MVRTRASGVSEDLAALKVAARQAGLTLACLFADSSEFEAAEVKANRRIIVGRYWKATEHVVLVALLAFCLTLL